MKFVAIHSCGGPAFYSDIKPKGSDRVTDIRPHVTNLDGSKAMPGDKMACGTCGEIWKGIEIRFEEIPQ